MHAFPELNIGIHPYGIEGGMRALRLFEKTEHARCSTQTCGWRARGEGSRSSSSEGQLLARYSVKPHAHCCCCSSCCCCSTPLTFVCARVCVYRYYPEPRPRRVCICLMICATRRARSASRNFGNSRDEDLGARRTPQHVFTQAARESNEWMDDDSLLSAASFISRVLLFSG